MGIPLKPHCLALTLPSAPLLSRIMDRRHICLFIYLAFLLDSEQIVIMSSSLFCFGLFAMGRGRGMECKRVTVEAIVIEV